MAKKELLLNKNEINQTTNDLLQGKVAYSQLPENQKHDKDCLVAACKFNMINLLLAPTKLREDKNIINELFEIDPKVMLLLTKKTYLDMDFMKDKIAQLNEIYKQKVQNCNPTQLLQILQEQRDIIKKISSYYDV